MKRVLCFRCELKDGERCGSIVNQFEKDPNFQEKLSYIKGSIKLIEECSSSSEEHTDTGFGLEEERNFLRFLSENKREEQGMESS